MTTNHLNNEEKQRYERQIMLPEIGTKGQHQLHSKRVLVVGAGGLGSPILYYLVAAGVGAIHLVDDDKVSLSNLQRQILYRECDLGEYKAQCAASRLKELNSLCDISYTTERFSPENASSLASGCDLIIDGCDNLATRYVMDSIAAELGIPYLYGAVEGWGGQISLFHYQGVGGYKELFDDFEPSLDHRPIAIMGSVVGIISSLMATEAIKTLLSLPSSIAGKLLRYDALTMQYTLLEIQS